MASNYALVRILVLRFAIPYASTKVNSYAMKLHLLVVHYSVLVMLNARLCDFSFLGWMRLNLFASLLLHQVGILLVHPKSLNPVLPYESTIPTYMHYLCVVLSKFVCAISNFQNEFPFCVLVLLMKR